MHGEALVKAAMEHAERGVSKLHFFKPDNKFASEELYGAWDQLQAAAETLRDAARAFGFPDPRH
jgi:hypothetical protein